MCRFTDSTNDPICKIYNPQQYNLPDSDPIFYGGITLQNFCTKNIVIEKENRLERECKKYSPLLERDSFHSGCHYASLKDPQRVTGSGVCSGWNFPEPGGLWGTCKVTSYNSANKFECCTKIDQTEFTRDSCFLGSGDICHPKYTIPTEKPCQDIFMNEIPLLIKNSSNKKDTFDTIVAPILNRQIYGPLGVKVPGQDLLNLDFAQNLMSQIFYQLIDSDKEIIYETCSVNPVLCQGFLRDHCAYEDYYTLINTPEKAKFCGCWMSEDVYSSYAQFGIPRECTPSCNMSGVIPYIDSGLNASYCKDTVCMISGVSILLNQSVVAAGGNSEGNSGSGGLDITQVCGNCVNTTSCECRISDTTITAIASDLGEIKIANFCSGNSVCTDSSGNSVPCTASGNTSTDPETLSSSSKSAFKEIINNFNILIPIIIISAVIVIFVFAFIIYILFANS